MWVVYFNLQQLWAWKKNFQKWWVLCCFFFIYKIMSMSVRQWLEKVLLNDATPLSPYDNFRDEIYPTQNHGWRHLGQFTSRPLKIGVIKGICKSWRLFFSLSKYIVLSIINDATVLIPHLKLFCSFKTVVSTILTLKWQSSKFFYKAYTL